MRERPLETCLYGTDEQPETLQRITVGPLSFLKSADGLRRMSWHGVEVIRAIAWPIRDVNWGTYPATLLDEELELTDQRCTGRVRFSVDEGRLICDLTYVAEASGSFRADLTMTPQGDPFCTNRAGFTVLHPIQGVAGQPLRVTHSDGRIEETVFPALISPGQPVMDIAGLRYTVEGAEADIVFDGDVFEMEDQRNWSDASFKTYCVPLVHPFTYEITGPTHQAIEVTFDGTGVADQGGEAPAVAWHASDSSAPAIGLAAEQGWLQSDAGMVANHVLLRLGPDLTGWDLADVKALLSRTGATLAVEIVLPQDEDGQAGLARARAVLDKAGLEPSHVLALPEAYLASHQPSGPWPDGTTPADLYLLVRAAFPKAAVGGGMMTNYTELNRCRPDPTGCDFITHGSTAIVHAGDDMSVLETLDCLPQIFASADALRGGVPYRLGLVSIGMRTNPYGAAVAENPAQVRRTMAQIDPRHLGLFGAAWAVGALAATQGSPVEALCLAAPTGPFGILSAPQEWPQAGYDGTAAQVTPLFHVHRAAHRMAGQQRLVFDTMPHGVAAYGVQAESGAQIIIANLSDAPKPVDLPAMATVRLLDHSGFDGAVTDMDWLDTAEPMQAARIDMPPFAIAFVALPGS